MPVLRRCGGSVSMRCSPNRMRPSSSSQKPATMRNSVVFPQPDGPSSVKNSPSRTESDTLSTARTVPNVRATPSIVIAVTLTPQSPASARALDDLLYLLHGLDALRHPGILVIVDDLDVGQLRHRARQLREVEVLARRPAEGKAQDRLAHVLAR